MIATLLIDEPTCSGQRRNTLVPGDSAPLARSWMLLRRPYGAGDSAAEADGEAVRASDGCGASEGRAAAAAPEVLASMLDWRCGGGGCDTELRAEGRDAAPCGSCIDDVRAGDMEGMRAGASGDASAIDDVRAGERDGMRAGASGEASTIDDVRAGGIDGMRAGASREPSAAFWIDEVRSTAGGAGSLAVCVSGSCPGGSISSACWRSSACV